MNVRLVGLGIAVAGAGVAVGTAFAGRSVPVVLGSVFLGVGLWQALTGRNDKKRGIGWLGVGFVVVIGFAGSLAALLIAKRTTPRPVTTAPVERAPVEVPPAMKGLLEATPVETALDAAPARPPL